MGRPRTEYFCFLGTLLTISVWIFLDILVVSEMIVGTALEQPSFIIGDTLVAPDIPSEHNSPVTPGYYETSEYLIGSVAVGVIFLESNGTIDPSTENWTSLEESQVIDEIQAALNWWSSQNPSANVSFSLTHNFSVPTSYEPISRPQTDEELWISEAMTYLGYPGDDYFTQVRDYVNDLRNVTDTDWAFAMFIVDSSNDADGKFADGEHFAYAYLGGPFLVLTYDNNDWGIDNMDRVAAHEIGHIFYATDEYNGETEYSGYLNVSDVEGSGGLMDSSANWFLSEGTKGQVGWRDSDGDNILDIVDTFPSTKLVHYPSNLTSNATLTYAGYSTEVPYPNSNPYGTGRNLTINTIIKVEYRIDSSEWHEASPVDGAYDEAVENFTFTISSLPSETSTVEVRGINSVGNAELSNTTHTVTVDSTPPVTGISYSNPNHKADSTVYVSKSTTFTLVASDDISGVANTYYKVDAEPWTNYTEPFNLSNLQDGEHTLYFYSVDKLGNVEPTRSFALTMDNTEPYIWFLFPSDKSAANSSTVNVTWTGLDYGSGIAYYEIKIDDEEYNNKGNSTKHTFLDVVEGSHELSLKAVDELGNWKESKITFIVDVTPPEIWATSPKNGSEIKSSNVKVIWSGFDQHSGIDYYQIKLDENRWINVSSKTDYVLSQLRDGIHKIDVRAVDKAGNHKQVRIIFTVNTSLLGKPGWTDDIIILSMTSFASAMILILMLKKQLTSQLSHS